MGSKTNNTDYENAVQFLNDFRKRSPRRLVSAPLSVIEEMSSTTAMGFPHPQALAKRNAVSCLSALNETSTSSSPSAASVEGKTSLLSQTTTSDDSSWGHFTEAPHREPLAQGSKSSTTFRCGRYHQQPLSRIPTGFR